MNILKMVGAYAIGHLICAIVSRYEDHSYEKDYRAPWLMLAFPSSLITHGHILAVRLACAVNIVAVIVTLYLIVCGVSGTAPIDDTGLAVCCSMGILSYLWFECFRMERYFAKLDSQKWEKRIRLFFAYLILVLSVFCALLALAVIFKSLLCAG